MCATLPVHLSLLDLIIPITDHEHIVWSYYFFCLESIYSSETLSVYVLQFDSVRVSAIQNKIYSYSFMFAYVPNKMHFGLPVYFCCSHDFSSSLA
jgi:hypothetical protein